jgi:hypothetical protein
MVTNDRQVHDMAIPSSLLAAAFQHQDDTDETLNKLLGYAQMPQPGALIQSGKPMEALLILLITLW